MGRVGVVELPGVAVVVGGDDRGQAQRAGRLFPGQEGVVQRAEEGGGVPDVAKLVQQPMHLRGDPGGAEAVADGIGEYDARVAVSPTRKQRVEITALPTFRR